jgi:hypothetical protein
MKTTPTPIRAWLLWTTSFLALPLGGFAGTLITGRVDSPLSALTGGAIAGPSSAPARHWPAAAG